MVRLSNGNVVSASRIHLTGSSATTLTGDFTGISVDGGWNARLTLGAANAPFEVQNTLGQETFIYNGQGNLTVNMVSGTVMERVYIGSHQGMNIVPQSGSAGASDLSIGAGFFCGRSYRRRDNRVGMEHRANTAILLTPRRKNEYGGSRQHSDGRAVYVCGRRSLTD
jgi:hypothetical protein